MIASFQYVDHPAAHSYRHRSGMSARCGELLTVRSCSTPSTTMVDASTISGVTSPGGHVQHLWDALTPKHECDVRSAHHCGGEHQLQRASTSSALLVHGDRAGGAGRSRKRRTGRARLEPGPVGPASPGRRRSAEGALALGSGGSDRERRPFRRRSRWPRRVIRLTQQAAGVAAARVVRGDDPRGQREVASVRRGVRRGQRRGVPSSTGVLMRCGARGWWRGRGVRAHERTHAARGARTVPLVGRSTDEAADGGSTMRHIRPRCDVWNQKGRSEVIRPLAARGFVTS
jgi:hypothetical protein